MSRFLALLAAPVLLLLLPAADAPDRPRLTFKGLGDVRIGMSSEQVKALGFRLTTSGPWDEIGDDYFVSCHYLDSSPKFPGIALMMSDDRVVRIDITFGSGGEGWKSLSGAGIGMSEQELEAIYGDWLQTSGHPYLGEAGSYLSLTSSDGKYRMIFETAAKDMSADGLGDKDQPKFVTDFRAGLTDAVGYIEGCA